MKQTNENGCSAQGVSTNRDQITISKETEHYVRALKYVELAENEFFEALSEEVGEGGEDRAADVFKQHMDDFAALRDVINNRMLIAIRENLANVGESILI